MIDDDLKAQVLDELTAEIIGPIIPPGAITVRMLMEQSGRIEKVCRALLDKKVREGKMGKILYKITNYYYPIK